MTTEEITAQLVECARLHGRQQMQNLPRHSVPTAIMAQAIERQFQAAYLSGVSQTASFLSRGDGQVGITPQNIMSAVSAAGKTLGFDEVPGNKGTRG